MLGKTLVTVVYLICYSINLTSMQLCLFVQTNTRSEALLFEVNSNECKDSRLYNMLRINEMLNQ